MKIKHGTLENLTASIIVNQLALHYNEQIKFTPHYKQNLKKSLRQTNNELIKAESKEFDAVFNHDEKLTHEVSSNIQTYIEFMTAKGFTNFMLLANMQIAYSKNPKAIEGIINKILND